MGSRIDAISASTSAVVSGIVSDEIKSLLTFGKVVTFRFKMNSKTLVYYSRCFTLKTADSISNSKGATP